VQGESGEIQVGAIDAVLLRGEHTGAQSGKVTVFAEGLEVASA
jgi:hypothetical protein